MTSNMKGIWYSIGMNTKAGGEVNFIIYKDSKANEYTAVCLDFDIIETGDDPDELRLSIEEAARMHITTIIEQGLSDKLLNRPAPVKYWNIAKKMAEHYEASLERDYHSKQISAKSATTKTKAGKSKAHPVSLDMWLRDTKELVPA